MLRPRVPLLAIAACALLGAAGSAQTYKTTKYNIGGDGAFDYLSVEPATGRVFVSRSTHVMVVDGATGTVVGDLPDTPRVHGIAFAPNGMGFTTNAGDSTSTMFDLKTLVAKGKVKAGKDGLDGIMFDDATGMILTINHSKPRGTAVVIDPKTGRVVSTITLTGNAPEGGVSDGQGRIFINLEDTNAIDVVDSKTWKVTATWPIASCDGPTGIALDRATHRLFSGCSDTSVVTDATTGKVVAKLPNGDGVDAIGWDPAERLIFIPAGNSGTATVVHEDSPNSYHVVETVPTVRGARTIAMDPTRHRAFVFTPEYGPAPTAPATAGATGGRPGRGPMTAAWLRALLGTFDVIILDIQLPRGNGFDLCREIRKRGVGTPVSPDHHVGDVVRRVCLGGGDDEVLPIVLGHASDGARGGRRLNGLREILIRHLLLGELRGVGDDFDLARVVVRHIHATDARHARDQRLDLVPGEIVERGGITALEILCKNWKERRREPLHLDVQPLRKVGRATAPFAAADGAA